MTALRTFSALRLWVLAWFVASMGVAIASPLVHPQAFEAVSYTHLTLPTTPYV